jgi:hypothetical protein
MKRRSFFGMLGGLFALPWFLPKHLHPKGTCACIPLHSIFEQTKFNASHGYQDTDGQWVLMDGIQNSKACGGSGLARNEFSRINRFRRQDRPSQDYPLWITVEKIN